MHSMQAGYLEKAQKYTDKALMQLEKLKSKEEGLGILRDSREILGNPIIYPSFKPIHSPVELLGQPKTKTEPLILRPGGGFGVQKSTFGVFCVGFETFHECLMELLLLLPQCWTAAPSCPHSK